MVVLLVFMYISCYIILENKYFIQVNYFAMQKVSAGSRGIQNFTSNRTLKVEGGNILKNMCKKILFLRNFKKKEGTH